MPAPEAAELIASKMRAAPIYESLAITLVAASVGAVELEVRCDERHCNVDGAVHGGFLTLLADTAMGFAVRTEIEPSWQNRTVSLSTDFYGPAAKGDVLSARASIEQASARFRWAVAELSAGGRVVCRARSLNSVRPPGQAG